MSIQTNLDDSGIYVARIYSITTMPVTRDKRYVDICARVDSSNVKVGKAKNFLARRKNYWADFDQENVHFQPIAKLDDIQKAETAILRHLKQYRLRSPKGGLMDWLTGIDIESVIRESYIALDQAGIEYERC